MYIYNNRLYLTHNCYGQTYYIIDRRLTYLCLCYIYTNVVCQFWKEFSNFRQNTAVNCNGTVDDKSVITPSFSSLCLLLSLCLSCVYMFTYSVCVRAREVAVVECLCFVLQVLLRRRFGFDTHRRPNLI